MGYPLLAVSGYKQITSLLSQEMSGALSAGMHIQSHFTIIYPYLSLVFPWSLFVFITFIHAIKQRKSMPATEKKKTGVFFLLPGSS